MFYPVFIDPAQRKIISVGDAVPLETPRSQVPVPEGVLAVWPLRTTGEEGRWRCAPATLRSLISQGYARVGAYDATNDRWSLLYLGASMIRRIQSGDIVVTGSDEAGAAIVEYGADVQATSAKTVWNRASHRAGEHGTRLLSTLLGERRFTFPKSLYAVQDTLRVACGGKKDALVVDFFAGSGTTLHAVAMLNEEDEGRRRCIIVTNNEVGADTASRLARQGYLPGDAEFEKHGIFWSVTKPRCEACITGNREDGTPVPGEYLNGKAMSEGLAENVDFYELTYLDRDSVSLGQAYEAIAPLLWLKAGAVGASISSITEYWSLPEESTYGVLFDPGKWRGFIQAVQERRDVSHVFIVTDSLAVYQQIVAELSPWVDSSMLYEDYLSNFELNTGTTR